MKLGLAAFSAILLAPAALARPFSVDEAIKVLAGIGAPASGSITYDDQDSVAKYYGKWTHIKQNEFNLQSKTQSYTAEANAEVHFPNPLPPTGKNLKISVFSTKSGDRGFFNVYCGKTLVGTGSEYARHAETDSTMVFHSDNAYCIGGQDFVVKNDKGAPFLAIDAFKFEWSA